MLCPGCGKDIPKGQTNCIECEQAAASDLKPNRKKSRGGFAPWQVGIVLALLVFALVAGAIVVVYGQRDSVETIDWPKFIAGTQQWTDMNYKPVGMEMQVPGLGWRLDYESTTTWTFKNDAGATLDVYLVSFMVFNNTYRVDNKPNVYTVQHERLMVLPGYAYPASLVKVEGFDAEKRIIKHQMHLQRSFFAHTQQIQTYVYLITLTYPSDLDAQYEPIFEHILGSIQFYDYR